MKKLPYIIIGVLAALCVAGWLRQPRIDADENVRVETRIRTDYKVETLYIPPTLLLYPIFIRTTPDTIQIGDTTVQREQAVYQDSLYRIVVGGYRPRIDSLTLYPRTVTTSVISDVHTTKTVNPKLKRWGLGVQAGYGYPYGAYVGVGVSYSFLMW